MPTPVSQQYPELLHNTTLAGLRGIVSSGFLWATDATFLNDSSEIRYFFYVRLRELVAEDAKAYAIELARTPKYLARMIDDGGIDRIVSMEADTWHSTLRSATLSMNRPFVLSLSRPLKNRPESGRPATVLRTGCQVSRDAVRRA